MRWTGKEKFQEDYNTLPQSNYRAYKIEEVVAHEAAVMDIGFVHFSRFDYFLTKNIVNKNFVSRNWTTIISR